MACTHGDVSRGPAALNAVNHFVSAVNQLLLQNVQRLIQSMDAMSLDAFIYPGWGNPPRLIGDLDQAGNTDLGTHLLDCLLLSSCTTV